MLAILRRRLMWVAFTRLFRREAQFFRELAAHPRTPLVTKVLLGLAMAYLVSPIDLIPDFVPILGQLDDVLILGGLVFMAVRLAPRDVVAECRARSRGRSATPSQGDDGGAELLDGRERTGRVG
jgi:uncharacterized membrane protein YkvA (DUF1232 family)